MVNYDWLDAQANKKLQEYQRVLIKQIGWLLETQIKKLSKHKPIKCQVEIY